MTYTKYFPKDITPKDDAYHPTKNPISEEWWYFDAIFDNNYSLHTDFTIFTKNGRFASSAIEIYKNGELESKVIKRHVSKPVMLSTDFPDIKLHDKKIINFDLDRFNKTGEWNYKFSQKLDDCEIDLNFIGTTKGWKIVTDDLSWTVAQPKATVFGEITVNGKKMKVNGIGYHDHNWNSTLLTFFKIFGWYWGKITSKTYNVTWANLMKNRTHSQIFAIFNKDNQGYFSINPENISLKCDKLIRNHGRKIPTTFNFKINDLVEDIPISADVKMEIRNMHFKSLLLVPYWRYHIKTSGYISFDSHKEQVNDTHIMEFFRIA
jgi:predicted secreted hydrolase